MDSKFQSFHNKFHGQFDFLKAYAPTEESVENLKNQTWEAVGRANAMPGNMRASVQKGLGNVVDWCTTGSDDPDKGRKDWAKMVARWQAKVSSDSAAAKKGSQFNPAGVVRTEETAADGTAQLGLHVALSIL